MKKTIALAAVLAASTAMAEQTKNPSYEDVAKNAIKTMTGPNQPETGEMRALCLRVSPYIMSSMVPQPLTAHKFHSFAVDGSGVFQAKEVGECAEIDPETKKCEEGFVKVLSTAPLACSVPIAL